MRRFFVWGLRLLALPLVAALAGVAAPAAGKPAQPIAAGVTIAGLPVGGFTPQEARGLVRREYGTPLEFRLGSDTWTATLDDLGVYASVDDAVTRAVHARPGSAVALSADVADSVIRAYLAELDARLSRPARDARFDGIDGDLVPVLVSEAAGRKLDRTRTRAAIERALATAAREPVVPVFRKVEPKVRRADLPPIVVIRRESNVLYLYEGAQRVATFGVATGTARYPTPLGTFEVVDKQYHPWWYPPNSDWARGKKPIPPGPGNPLGTRWMGLNVYGVGIHGTPDAASIGYSASHGCIRMRIPDAEWLFERVRHGSPVVIVSA